MAGTLVHGREDEAPQQRVRRSIALFVLILIAVGALVFRLAIVQLTQGQYFQRLANQNQLRIIPMAAPRGLMYDRRGVVIVRNRPSFVVQIVPMQLDDPSNEMRELAALLGVNVTELWRRLLHQNGVTYRTFSELAAAIPLGPINIAEDLSPPVVGRFSERADRFPGMSVELVPVRDYPHHTLGSHYLGYVGQITQAEYRARKSAGYGQNDIVGEDGLEATYDRWLRGRSGGQQIKVNSAGEAVAMLGPVHAVPGNDLQLSIDWGLQRAAETAVAAQINLLKKQIGQRIGGSALVEDVHTGEILALVSQPNIDPNDFAAGISSKKYDAYLRDPLHSLFNRAISGAYPTGSTFKLITASAALASGMMAPDATRYCGGAFALGDFVFNDDRAGGHGTLTIPQAITESCDVFFYQVGHQLGIDRIAKYAGAYGIGSKTGIDLPGETSGTLPSPQWKQRVYKDVWYPGDTVSVAIGQGYLEASPLQMLKVVGAIANGGTEYQPRLVTAIRDPQGRVIKQFAPQAVREVPVPPEDLDIIRKGMLGVIESPYGTAHNVYIPGFHYAGKTGTAENVPTADNPSGRNHAWFVCYAPYDNPQIAVVVFMDQSGGFGAVNAAPVAQAIVQSYFHIKTSGPNGRGIRD
ncbi:MAG TPA: penicillin-binding protein 2 [Candidatus Eremiobacteraceae bacterium]|nr:penicillin-binding protein 2 [Candidatus Eremiobacteraceae bacterium]